MLISFRPHHFLCALCFQGKGYSAPFIHNFTQIMATLNAQENNVMIQVTGHTDSICTPCPHRRGELCQSQAKVSKLDQAHQAALGFYPQQQLSWLEAKATIKAQLTLTTFHQICVECEWYKSGICESVLEKFL